MNLNLIVIRTELPEALSKFYTLLGFNFQFHRHGNGPFHFSTKINETVFEIYPLLKNQKDPDKSTRLGFSVDKLDSLIEKLKKNNVEIFKEPKMSEWGYFAVVKDLDGRKIELTEK